MIVKKFSTEHLENEDSFAGHCPETQRQTEPYRNIKVR